MAQAELIQKQEIDLSALSVEELKRLSERAEKQIKALEEQKRKDAFKKLEDLASQLGLTKADLAARFGGKKAAIASNPKYRNPADPAQTWTGRGRKPAWVIQHLEKGAKLDELAIS